MSFAMTRYPVYTIICDIKEASGEMRAQLIDGGIFRAKSISSSGRIHLAEF